MDNFSKGKNIFTRVYDGLSSLKLQYQIDIINGYIKIDLPYFNYIGDNFVVYLIDLSNNNYQLTDDGWTIDEFNNQNQSAIHNIIKHNNVQEQDGDIFINFNWTKDNDFADVIRKMIQTMIGLDALLKV